MKGVGWVGEDAGRRRRRSLVITVGGPEGYLGCEVKLARPLVFSTDVWTSIEYRFPKTHLVAVLLSSQGTEMRGFRKCLRNGVLVDKHYHMHHMSLF